MTDTGKYEGHTPTKEWGDIVYADGYRSIFLDENVQYLYATDTDRRLMAAAPHLLEEVKKLQDKITLMEMQYVGLEQAYYDSPAETENKRLRELLVEAAHCIHEMEGMAYAEADPDDFAKHAMEFRGNVSTTIGADAPWGDEE